MNTFNDTGEPVGRASWCRVLIFLLAASLFYPFALFVPLPLMTLNTGVQLFNPASLSLLALFFCLMDFEKLTRLLREHSLLSFCAVVFTLIVAVQFLIKTTYSFENLCASLAWLCIPLFCCLNHAALVRCLPYWVLFLWLLNLFHGILLLMADCYEFSGLSGNRNWQAIFLVASTPFVIYLFWAFLRGKLRCPIVLAGLLSVIPLVPVSYLFWHCESRGAWLALVVCIICAGLIMAGKRHLKTCVWIFAACGLLLAAWMFLGGGSDLLAKKIAEDVRIPLWEGTLELIQENPVIGIGQPSFESAFAPHRPAEYFMRMVAAVRSNHPHNHFLHIAVSFGVLGFFAWGVLLFYPLIIFCQRLGEHRKNPVLLLSFFAFLALFTHAMFDIVFDEWPTNILALLLLGIFWAMAWPVPKGETETIESSIPRFLTKCCSLFLGIVLLLLLAQIFMGSNYYRNGIICTEFLKDSPAGAEFLERSVAWRKNPIAIYKALTHANGENPALVLRYGKILVEQTPYLNFGHNNGFIGYNLGKLNRFRDAQSYLIQEVKNYPIGIGGWYNLMINQMALGRRSEAEETYKVLMACIKIKGFAEEDLQRILSNPQLDIRPKEVREDSQKLQKKE